MQIGKHKMTIVTRLSFLPLSYEIHVAYINCANLREARPANGTTPVNGLDVRNQALEEINDRKFHY
jgi:hypothetical protein